MMPPVSVGMTDRVPVFMGRPWMSATVTLSTNLIASLPLQRRLPSCQCMSMHVTCIYVLDTYINDLYINDMYILVWVWTWGLDKRVCIKASTRAHCNTDVCIQDISWYGYRLAGWS